MQPINQRRNTNQFHLLGTTVEQLARIHAAITEEFPGWHIVAVGQNAEELAAEWFTFGVRISKRDQGIVDIQVELRGGGTMRVVEARWVMSWVEDETDREPITDLEKALAHELD